MDKNNVTKSTLKKRAIIDVATKLFSERGIDAVGVREISSKANVSQGLIRFHFGSKMGLKAAIDENVIKQLTSLYDNISNSGVSTGMTSLVDDIVEYMSEQKHVLLYIRMALLQNDLGSAAMVRSIHSIVTVFVDQCEIQGNLKENVNKEQMAMILMFDLLGPVILEPFSSSLVGSSFYTPEQVAARNSMTLKMLTQGLLRK